MKNEIIIGKNKGGKGGYGGNEMWRTHRLEGVVKKRSIKPAKKKKRDGSK